MIDKIEETKAKYISENFIEPNVIVMTENMKNKLINKLIDECEIISNKEIAKKHPLNEIQFVGMKIEINNNLKDDEVYVYNDKYYVGVDFAKEEVDISPKYVVGEDIEENIKTKVTMLNQGKGKPYKILSIIQESTHKEESLSDKRRYGELSSYCTERKYYYSDEDVKEAVKKLINDYRVNNNGDSIKAIKDIFGEELIK